jgi:hypothetical protein
VCYRYALTLYRVFEPRVWLIMALIAVGYAAILWFVDHGGHPRQSAQTLLASELPELFHKAQAARHGSTAHAVPSLLTFLSLHPRHSN